MEGSYIYINDSYVGHSGDGPRERGEMKHRAGSIRWEAGRGLLLGDRGQSLQDKFWGGVNQWMLRKLKGC